MAVRVLLTMVAVFGLVASAAAARTLSDLKPVPIQSIKAPPSGGVVAHPPLCEEAYSNIAINLGFYFPAGAGVEVLDDLHLGPFVVARTCAFDIGYYKATAGPTDATVTFYRGSPEDDPPGTVLGTYALPGLPGGENGFHIEVFPEALTQDVWMGVSFSTDETGLLIADPPWPGASDDYFYMTPPADYFTFGYPKANFLLGVYAAPPPTEVGPTTEHRPGFASAPAPNPTSAGVSFRFAVSREGPVRAEVLDIAGRIIAVVVDKAFAPGVYGASWDGRTIRGKRAAAGVYLLRLAVPGFAGTRKVSVTN